MKNFKPGQPVVFDTKGKKMSAENAELNECNQPKNGEIVHIKECLGFLRSSDMFFYSLQEYPTATTGQTQGFGENILHPLNEAGKQLSENLLTKIENEINQQQFVEV